MTTHVLNASNANAPARVPAATRAGDPALLTQTELDTVAAGGGGAGVNPSRSSLRG